MAVNAIGIDIGGTFTDVVLDNSGRIFSKKYLTTQEFLSGISFVQAMPGPVFSMTGYIGAISMKEMGIIVQILGGIIALLGIFLPGTFLIFFVIINERVSLLFSKYRKLSFCKIICFEYPRVIALYSIF